MEETREEGSNVHGGSPWDRPLHGSMQCPQMEADSFYYLNYSSLKCQQLFYIFFGHTQGTQKCLVAWRSFLLPAQLCAYKVTTASFWCTERTVYDHYRIILLLLNTQDSWTKAHVRCLHPQKASQDLSLSFVHVPHGLSLHPALSHTVTVITLLLPFPEDRQYRNPRTWYNNWHILCIFTHLVNEWQFHSSKFKVSWHFTESSALCA